MPIKAGECTGSMQSAVIMAIRNINSDDLLKADGFMPLLFLNPAPFEEGLIPAGLS
jgi:hypothetical protein